MQTGDGKMEFLIDFFVAMNRQKVSGCICGKTQFAPDLFRNGKIGRTQLDSASSLAAKMAALQHLPEHEIVGTAIPGAVADIGNPVAGKMAALQRFPENS